MCHKIILSNKNAVHHCIAQLLESNFDVIRKHKNVPKISWFWLKFVLPLQASSRLRDEHIVCRVRRPAAIKKTLSAAIGQKNARERLIPVSQLDSSSTCWQITNCCCCCEWIMSLWKVWMPSNFCATFFPLFVAFSRVSLNFNEHPHTPSLFFYSKSLFVIHRRPSRLKIGKSSALDIVECVPPSAHASHQPHEINKAPAFTYQKINWQRWKSGVCDFVETTRRSEIIMPLLNLWTDASRDVCLSFPYICIISDEISFLFSHNFFTSDSFALLRVEKHIKNFFYFFIISPWRALAAIRVHLTMLAGMRYAMWRVCILRSRYIDDWWWKYWETFYVSWESVLENLRTASTAIDYTSLFTLCFRRNSFFIIINIISAIELWKIQDLIQLLWNFLSSFALDTDFLEWWVPLKFHIQTLLALVPDFVKQKSDEDESFLSLSSRKSLFMFGLCS